MRFLPHRAGTLADWAATGLTQPVTTDPPPSPFKLTRQRILLLVLGVFALLLIVGSLMGGLGNYQALRESVPSSEEAGTSSSAGR